MKRTELIELAKEVDFAGRRMLAFRFEEEGYACQKASALLRQIAESKPVAWVANGFLYHEAAHVPKGWRAEVRVLSELPLED